MIKKGSSRKGDRRRKSTSADEAPRPETMTPAPLASRPRTLAIQEIQAEAIKLEVDVDGVALEFTRAEIVETVAEQDEQAVAPLSPQELLDSERNWGAQETDARHYTFLGKALAGTVLLLFLCIGLYNLFSANSTGTTEKEYRMEVVDDGFDPNSPLYRFQHEPIKVNQECLAVLRAVTTATAAKDIMPYIRKQEGIEKLLAKYWKPWESPPREATAEYIYSYDEVDGRAFYSIEGLRQDNTPFALFFVIQDDKMVMDWAASMGIGDARLSTLVENPTENPLMLRVIVEPSPYYLSDFPEDQYESYKITQPGDEAIVWGYVERNSQAHFSLCSALQVGSVLLEPLPQVAVTLKLKRPPHSLVKNRFFITEMLHKGWVMP